MFRITLIRYAALLCMLVLAWPVVGESTIQSSDDYAFKITVETHLEQRLSSVLTDIAGTDDIIVIVNAEVEADKAQGKKVRSTRKLVLPGVPVKKEIGKGGSTEDRQGLLSISSVVRKLEVTILVDNNIPESLTEIVHDVAISVIGYNPDRGDKLNIKRIDFGRRGFRWASIFYPPHLYWFITVIVVGFFLVSTALFFMDPFKKLVSAVDRINWGAITGVSKEERSSENMPILLPAAAAEIEAAVRTDGEQPLPFSFVKEKNLPELAFLLSGRPAQDIAIAFNYLDPDLSTKLLESLPAQTQTEVALLLAKSEQADPEKVESLEKSIREQLDYVVGGDGKLASILSLADSDVREKVLDELEGKDPDAALLLRKKLKSFESIIRAMKPHALQALFRQLDVAAFARVLKSSSADLGTKVLESLSEGAAERLKEEMELSRPLSATRLKKEKQNIVTTVRRMTSAGIIEEEDY